MKGRWTKTKGWNRWDYDRPDVDSMTSVIVATSDGETGEAYLDDAGAWRWANDNPIIGAEVGFWQDLPESPEWMEIPEREKG